MADPISYTPGYSFTDYQVSNPRSPLPGDEVDSALIDIAAAIDDHRSAIMDVRRSDGKLKNQIVSYDSLNADMKARLSQIGFDTTVLALADSGSVARSLGSHFGDIINPRDFGAVGGGIVDDKDAIDLAALVDSGQVYLPPGIWQYGSNDFGSLAGMRFHGPGQVKVGNNKQARDYAYLAAPPASLGDTGGIFTAFNGDHSKSLLALGYRVGGATTLGNPASGYYQRPEAAAIHGHAHVNAEAGKNQALDWTDGRTGWSFAQIQLDHYGQGDTTIYSGRVNIFNNKANGTHFLAQPAGNFMGGTVEAYADHVNAVVGEFYVNGRDKDINGTGFAIHFNRNVATGAQEAFWRGISILSSGTQAIDTAFVARGKIRRGFEIGAADLGTGQAAIAMSAGQRIYGNVTYQDTSSANPLASGHKVFQSLQSAYFEYATTINNWLFNNPITAIGQLSSTNAAGNNRGLNIQTNNSNRWRLLGDGVAESTGNVGTNFKLTGHDNAGAELYQAMIIERSNGNMRLGVAGASMGFFGGAGTGKPTISGSRGSNAALASLITAGANLGLWTDSSS